MKKKLFTVGMVMALMVCVLTGCAETAETKYTDELKQQISDRYGFPDVSNFFEYSQFKEIYEMRDNPDLICYWYTKNDMSGKWVYQGECIGYGIPYGASITAPESYQRLKNVGWERLPLAEPSGIYTNGVSSSATWILTTDKDGNIKPTYVECEITVSQTKLDKMLCEEWSIPDDY